MKDFVQVAQKVVEAVTNIVPFPISLSDEHGYIIGATNKKRIGTLHTPSREVLAKNTFLLFDEEKVKDLPNVMPGVAAPLILDDQTVGVIGIIGPPKEVEPYAQLVIKYVETIWQETIQQQKKELETKTLETFAQYLLLNDEPMKSKIQEYCRILNIPYARKRFCIMIDIGNSLIDKMQRNLPIDQLKERLLNCTRKAFQSSQADICTFLNTEKIVMLKAIHTETDYFTILQKFDDQSSHLRSMFVVYHINDISIGVGHLSKQLEFIHHSYLDAKKVRDLGKRLNIKPPIYSYHDWNMLKQFLPDQINPNFLDKVQTRIKPLLNDDHRSELIGSFLIYCENNMNTTQAAKALFIHRNTLIYRLRKIESTVGIDTGSFEQCMILYLVLKGMGIERGS
ncbi:CdaR family transcriptional regulator [Oceanobacillus halotolerans]|uniref:CdaR family transcriptional regulator n=1 Tax=Oceanobacillus halotolerans TaxID=2663380 RepID=UPI0013DCB338|nr:sugar diacid recognition domain-containing protein [Oceanobacillus halotolerans]